MELDAKQENLQRFLARHSLLRSKISQGRSLERNVIRKACLQKVRTLCQEVDWRVTTVIAPAGFGKSNFVKQWEVESGLTACWLSLDTDENNLSRFILYLLASLKLRLLGSDPDFASDLESLICGPKINTAEVGSRLLSAIAGLDQRVYLVIDDFHLIDNVSVIDFMQYLVSNLPRNLKLIYISREVIALKVAKYRAAQEVIEIGQEDLRFSERETIELLRDVLKLSVSDEQVEFIRAKTEGWVAALQLWAMSAAGELSTLCLKNKGLEIWNERFEYIEEYLIEEVLANQDEDTTRFLQYTSVLSRFNASLCDYVIDGMGGLTKCEQVGKRSKERLRCLESANTFLLALDSEKQWYRYHHLFSSLLRSRFDSILSRREKTKVHKLASEWFEDKKQLQEAFEHAVQSQDISFVNEFLERNIEGRVLKGLLSQALQWFSRIDESDVTSPVVLIWLTWVRLFSHRIDPAAIEACLLKVEKQCEKMPSYNETFSSVYAHIGGIRGFVATFLGDSKAGIRISSEALKKYPDIESSLKGTIAFNITRSYTQLGDIKNTLIVADEAITECYAGGSFYGGVASAHQKGQALLQLNRISEAEQVYKNTLNFISDKRLGSHPFNGYLYTGLADLNFYRCAFDEAQELAGKGIKFSESGYEVKSLLQGYMLMSRIMHMIKDECATRDYALKAEMLSQKIYAPEASRVVSAYMALVDCLYGELNSKAIVNWERGLCHMNERRFGEMTEIELMVLAAINHARGKCETALADLNWLEKHAEGYGRKLSLIKILLSKSHVIHSQRKTNDALGLLDRAIGIANDAKLEQCFYQVFLWLPKTISTDVVKTPGEMFSSLRTRVKQEVVGAQDRRSSLTFREKEVLGYIKDGMSNKSIGEKMSISEGTVKRHIHNIFSKLQVKNRVEAIQSC